MGLKRKRQREAEECVMQLMEESGIGSDRRVIDLLSGKKI
jgi:hypothetical protein